MLSIPSRHDLRLTTARQGEHGYKCGHVTGLRRLGVTQKTASRTTQFGLRGGPATRGPVVVGDVPQQPPEFPAANGPNGESSQRGLLLALPPILTDSGLK